MGVNSINNPSSTVDDPFTGDPKNGTADIRLSSTNSAYNATASENLNTYSGKIHQAELQKAENQSARRQGATEVLGTNAR